MISFIKRKIHNLVSDKKSSEILAGSTWALGAKVIGTVLGMVSSIIVARAYGAEVRLAGLRDLAKNKDLTYITENIYYNLEVSCEQVSKLFNGLIKSLS